MAKKHVGTSGTAHKAWPHRLTTSLVSAFLCCQLIPGPLSLKNSRYHPDASLLHRFQLNDIIPIIGWSELHIVFCSTTRPMALTFNLKGVPWFDFPKYTLHLSEDEVKLSLQNKCLEKKVNIGVLKIMWCTQVTSSVEDPKCSPTLQTRFRVGLERGRIIYNEALQKPPLS